MKSITTRAIEVARAWNGVEGDSGEWNTSHYDIPSDTPEDKIEEVALAACREEHKGANGAMQYCWVYSIPSLDDEDSDPDDEGA